LTVHEVTDRQTINNHNAPRSENYVFMSKAKVSHGPERDHRSWCWL